MWQSGNTWEGSEWHLGVLVAERVGAALGAAAVLSQAVTCWVRAVSGFSFWFYDFVVLSGSWKGFSEVCGSSVAASCRGWGSVSLSPQLLQLVQPFFLQILLFSSNLSSFPLLQHWLLPVRNCSSIPCAEVHLLSSLQWANCSLCPVGTGWVFSGAGVGCYHHLGCPLVGLSTCSTKQSLLNSFCNQ